MTHVTLSVSTRQDVTGRALAAFRGDAQEARISFASVDLLRQTLTRDRWALLGALVGHGPMSFEDAARRAGRSDGCVVEDITALLDAGVLDRVEQDRIVFPFDALRVDFTLLKAA